MQKQRGCFGMFVSKKNEDLLGGVNSVSKNDGIENIDMDCEVREESNVNENITGLQIVHNLTPSLDVHYLLDGENSVNKNDEIENTDVDCEVQEVSNVNINITGLQNVQNLTSPLDVQETQNTLNDRYIYDLNDPGCWPSEITHNIRIEIVSLGVKRNTHQEFPANNENPPRKFTSYHFYRTMSNTVNASIENG